MSMVSTSHVERWNLWLRMGTRRFTRLTNALGMAGVDLGQALAEAKTRTLRAYPSVREALPAVLDEQVELRNLRRSTASAYKSRLSTWAFPRLGAVPRNLVTREDIGALLLAIRKAGKSAATSSRSGARARASTSGSRTSTVYRGPNPAAELKFFMGKQPSKRSRKRDVQRFRHGEARTLLEACQAHKPRWLAFSCVLRRGPAVGRSDRAVER